VTSDTTNKCDKICDSQEKHTNQKHPKWHKNKLETVIKHDSGKKPSSDLDDLQKSLRLPLKYDYYKVQSTLQKWTRMPLRKLLSAISHSMYFIGLFVFSRSVRFP